MTGKKAHCQVALQVRLGSQRLPQKALLTLGRGSFGLDSHKPCVLDWVLHHLRQSQRAERFLLLCPEGDCEALSPYARHFVFTLFGGSEDDVLERFCRALEQYPADYCFRVTADNPLVCGSLLDFMWDSMAEGPLDYAWIRGLPCGFAAELLRSEALLATQHPPLCGRLEPQDREHVTRFLYRHPEYFSLRYAQLDELLGPQSANLSELRLTLDTAEDYRFLQSLFASLQEQGLLPSSVSGAPLEFSALLRALSPDSPSSA